jgi:fructokinase
VLVGGESLVDLVPDTGPVPPDPRLRPLVPRLGGAGLNLAVALGRLGTATTMLTRIATDPFGDALVERLSDNGVAVDLVQRGPEPTSLAVVTLDRGVARYGFYVDGTADRLVADPGPVPDDVGAVALSGFSLVLEPGATVYADVLESAAGAGRLVAVDPNIRPGLIPDPDAHRVRLRSWLPSVGLLKLSDEDAAWWAGVDPGDDLDPAIGSWLDAGVGAVVLTRGGRPLRAISRAAGSVEVPVAAPPDDADDGDTIGAGDTVYAAVLAWLAEHGRLDPQAVAALDAHGWTAALRFAAVAASITCARPGADPPTRDEVGARPYTPA